MKLTFLLLLLIIPATTVIEAWRTGTLFIGGTFFALAIFVAIKYIPILRERQHGVLAWHIFFLAIGSSIMTVLTGLELWYRFNDIHTFTYRLIWTTASYLFLFVGLVMAFIRVKREHNRLLPRGKVFDDYT